MVSLERGWLEYNGFVTLKRITASFLATFVALVLCAAAVCDLDCTAARSSAAPSAASAVARASSQSAMQPACARCRHCGERPGSSIQSGAALAHLNFYLLRTHEKLSSNASRGCGLSQPVPAAISSDLVGFSVAAFGGPAPVLVGRAALALPSLPLRI